MGPLDAGDSARGQAEADDSLSAYVRRSVLDAYSCSRRVAELTGRNAAAAASYPDTGLAGKLRTIAQLLKADLGARVYYTTQSGYDTHAGQSNTHYQLLSELSGAIKAFLDDLTAAKLADRVTVLCFSEFGRRVAENSSAGTDHGTAGLVMLAGPGVRPGVHGSVPSLTDLVDGDPKISTDFRSVYAAVLEDWLGLPSQAALGSKIRADASLSPATIVRYAWRARSLCIRATPTLTRASSTLARADFLRVSTTRCSSTALRTSRPICVAAGPRPG